MVTLLYFSLIYPSLTSLDLIDYLKHTIPALFQLIDYFANTIVIESSYVAPALAYGVLYICWLVYYTTSEEDRYIYIVLKLENSTQWALLVGILVFYFIVFQFIRLLNHFKFAGKLAQKRQSTATVSSSIEKASSSNENDCE